MANVTLFSGSRRWPLWLAMLGLAGYAMFLGANSAPAPIGADSGGYLLSAKLITAGELTTPYRTPVQIGGAESLHFLPLGMQVREPGELAPNYPVGVPLHFAAFAPFVGWHWAPILTGVGGALAAMLLIYLSARRLGVSPAAAVIAAGSYGVSPIVFVMAASPLSDALAATWCAAAFYAGLRARQDRSPVWSIACGAALGIAVLVRPTNAVMLPALIVLLGNWRWLAGAAAGGLPIAIALGVYQNALYGSPLISGYGAIWRSLAWKEVGPSLDKWAFWLPNLLPFSVLAVALAWRLPWRERPRDLTALALWATGFIAFYCFYIESPRVWWNIRFIIPAFPALLLLAALALEGFVARLEAVAWRRLALAAAALAVAGLAVFRFQSQNLLPTDVQSDEFERAAAWAGSELPQDAVVACMMTSTTLYFHTGLATMRWDQVAPESFGRYAELLGARGTPIFALLSTWEIEDALTKNMPGNWRPVAEFGDLKAFQLELAPAKP